MNAFRNYYGGQPLHLLATLAAFALVAAGFAGWVAPGADARGVLVWGAVCVVAVDLVLLPFAWLLDRIAFGLGHRHRASQTTPAGAGWAYVRLPAMLSALMLLVFAPLIFRLGNATFIATTGITPSGYVYRWLLFSAAVFGISAVLYAISLRRARRRSTRIGL